MMPTTANPLVEDYLARLERAGRALGRTQRTEILAEIRGHLQEGLPGDATEVDIRNLLDELGTPEDIVAAARPGWTPARRGPRELFALILLVAGFPPVLGWLIGAVLAVRSRLWSKKQKLLALITWPLPAVGLWLATFQPALTVRVAGPLPTCYTFGSLGGAGRCGGADIHGNLAFAAVLIAVVACQVLCAVYLYRAAGRRSATD